MKQSQICRIFVFTLLCLLSLTSQAAKLPTPEPSAKATESLAQFVQHIWQNNPEIQSAKSEVDRASAEFSQSRRPIYNPDLNFEAEQVRKESQEDTYTAGISQTIDLFNTRAAQAQVGQYGFAEAKANLSEQQLVLATEALKALAEYHTARSVVRLAKRRTQLLRRFREQNIRKFKSGDIAQDALDQASLAYAEAISQQADEEITLTESHQRLIAITQISSKYWPALPRLLPKPLRPSGAKLERWLQDLPRMQLYTKKVAVAQASVRVAQTQTKPDPTISLGGGAEDSEPLFNVGLSIPLFVRNNFKDQVSAASHQAIAAEQERMSIYRHANAELSGNLSRYRILHQATGAWHEASKHSLNGGMQLLNRLWSAGELSTTDYLAQLKQRIDSQIAGVELKGKAWQMWFSVLGSSGQLTQWLFKKQ